MNNRPDLALKRITAAICKSIVDSSEEEIMEDARLAGVDIEKQADKIRQMLLDTLAEYRLVTK